MYVAGAAAEGGGPVRGVRRGPAAGGARTPRARPPLPLGRRRGREP